MQVSVESGEPVIAQPFILAHVQAKEADIQALSELTRALDKKVILLVWLYASILDNFGSFFPIEVV